MNQKQLTDHPSVGKHPDRPSHTAISARGLGHAEEPSDDIEGGFSRILRRLLLPLAVTAVAGLIFVTALTVAAFNSPDPTALVTPLSAAALALASLVGGITAGKCHGERAVAGSLISGCLLAALLCLLALLIGGEAQGMPPAVAWLIRLATIPVHMIGGILARPKQKPATHTAGKHPSHRR